MRVCLPLSLQVFVPFSLVFLKDITNDTSELSKEFAKSEVFINFHLLNVLPWDEMIR